MLQAFRAKKSSVFFWAIIILLIIGLAGFGIGVGGIGARHVAQVGDREISQQAYARAYDQELRAIAQQLGRALTPAEGQQFGIDRYVLARLVNDAALDNEAERLGISAGDGFVSRQILATPAFQGLDGSFDREAYRFALDRSGLSVREFEAEIRREAAREIVAASLQAPTAMPEVAAETVLGYLGESRAFAWIALDPSVLEAPVPEPGEEALRAFHGEHPERYTVPETRRIAYAMLDAEALAATIEIDEARLREAYEADPERFNTPERRYLDRIGFGSEAEAAEARARLDTGEVGFDGLAAERELSPEDIDQGLVAASELAPEAREAVFGAEGPGIVGPVPTPLGPSLFRINGVVAASTTPFEAAQGDLARELALDEARRQVIDEGAVLEDLVAGGARVEEIAEETPASLAAIELNALSAEPIAADQAFREAAEAAEVGVETDPVELADGSIVVLRVDEVVPPTLQPFEAVRDQVAADWRAAETAERLTATAEEYADELAGGVTLGDLAERLGVEMRSAGPLTRGESVPGAPEELLAEAFALEPGRATALPAEGGAILVQLERVEPFDPSAPESAGVLEAAHAQLRQQVSDDMLALYTMALQAEAGVTVDQELVQSTLAGFQ